MLKAHICDLCLKALVILRFSSVSEIEAVSLVNFGGRVVLILPFTLIFRHLELEEP